MMKVREVVLEHTLDVALHALSELLRAVELATPVDERLVLYRQIPNERSERRQQLLALRRLKYMRYTSKGLKRRCGTPLPDRALSA